MCCVPWAVHSNRSDCVAIHDITLGFYTPIHRTLHWASLGRIFPAGVFLHDNVDIVNKLLSLRSEVASSHLVKFVYAFRSHRSCGRGEEVLECPEKLFWVSKF